MKSDKTWKGYTMAELQQIRVVNRIKGDLIIEQIKVVASNAITTQYSGSKQFEEIQKYFYWATMGAKIFKSVKSIYDTLRR